MKVPQRALLAIVATLGISFTTTLAVTVTSANAGDYVDAADVSVTSGLSGTAANGVSYTINRSFVSHNQTMVWMFSEPVKVRFSVSGLNCSNEGMRVFAPAVLDELSPGHHWNETTRILTGPAPTPESSWFRINDPVTSFSVQGVGAAGCFRAADSATIYAFANEAPTATITTPAEGATYYQGQVVNAEYSCSDVDNTPEQVTCAGDEPNGSPIDTSTVGARTFTVNASDTDGGSSTATANFNVVPITGSCSGIAVAVGNGLRVAEANPGGDPCVSDSENAADLVIPLGVQLPPPFTSLNGSIAVTALDATSTKAGNTHSATASVAEVTIKYPLMNWSFTQRALISSVSASPSPAGCAADPVLTGEAKLGTWTINGRTYQEGQRPAQIGIPNVLSIHFNDVHKVGNTVTAHPLTVDLPGNALDVVVGESTASVGC